MHWVAAAGLANWPFVLTSNRTLCLIQRPLTVDYWQPILCLQAMPHIYILIFFWLQSVQCKYTVCNSVNNFLLDPCCKTVYDSQNNVNIPNCRIVVIRPRPVCEIAWHSANTWCPDSQHRGSMRWLPRSASKCGVSRRVEFTATVSSTVAGKARRCRSQPAGHKGVIISYSGIKADGRARLKARPSRCSRNSVSRERERGWDRHEKSWVSLFSGTNRPSVSDLMRNLQSAPDITCKRDGERSGKCEASGDGRHLPAGCGNLRSKLSPPHIQTLG